MFAAKPGLVERHEDGAPRECVGHTHRQLGLAGLRANGRRPPSARPSGRASSGWTSTNGAVAERGLELVGALGQPAVVDEQRVREELEPRGAPARAGSANGVIATSRGASRRPISSCSSSSVSKPRSPPHASGHAREDLPVRARDPRGAADGCEPLAAALPVGHVPVLLEERRGGQERVA